MDERLKALIQVWRKLAIEYEIRGHHAKTESECVRYAGMHATMSHCAESLEETLKGVHSAEGNPSGK